MEVEFKDDVDLEILGTHKKFEGFAQKKKMIQKVTLSPFIFMSTYNDLPGTYIDIYDGDEISQRWVFNKFEWFPEGVYGELFQFFNGGDSYDYNMMCERRKFLLTGKVFDKIMIDIEGTGWKKLSDTSLYDIFNDAVFTK